MNCIARSISRASTSYRAPASEVRTKSLFQSCTRRMSASPPVAKARSRFSVQAAAWYARTRRCGSGRRASGTGARPLTMSPRYDGSPKASTVDDRGLAYWPAILATLSTGMLAP